MHQIICRAKTWKYKALSGLSGGELLSKSEILSIWEACSILAASGQDRAALLCFPLKEEIEVFASAICGLIQCWGIAFFWVLHFSLQAPREPSIPASTGALRTSLSPWSQRLAELSLLYAITIPFTKWFCITTLKKELAYRSHLKQGGKYIYKEKYFR